MSDEPTDLRASRRRGDHPIDLSRLERLPPSSTEAEQAVIGCLLLDPAVSLPIAIERIKNSDQLYDLRHQTVFDELVAMFDARITIDLVTLSQRLKDKNQLESVGGLSYLAALPDAVPSASSIEYYLDIVWDKYVLRKSIRVCTEFVGRAYEYQGETDEVLDEFETDVLKLSQERDRGTGTLPIKLLVHKAVDTIEKYHQNQGAVTGLSTGFSDFDKITTGLHPGDMIVIAARPGLGKTSMAMNIAEHVALELKLPVGIFSLEMTADSLVLRMICSCGRVNVRNVREGFLAERDFPRITNAAGKIGESPIYIDDSSGLSILQLRAKARRMQQQHGIKLLVVDYLQLLHSTDRRAENKEQETADISRGIKGLAKELNIPVVVLCQLNREIEKREAGAKPKLSDLRQSGQIEADADLVGLLYRPNAEEGDIYSDTEQVNLLIAKQRNGCCGDLHFTFLKSFTRFETASKVSSDDVPSDI
jgi:replicative DNA helicase